MQLYSIIYNNKHTGASQNDFIDCALAKDISLLSLYHCFSLLLSLSHSPTGFLSDTTHHHHLLSLSPSISLALVSLYHVNL